MHARLTLVLLALWLATTKSAVGQSMGKQTGCYADSIAANPNRPTVSNPAHVTQYGVLELEYGWDQLWREENIHRTSVGGLLKFGSIANQSCKLEFMIIHADSTSLGIFGLLGHQNFPQTSEDDS